MELSKRIKFLQILVYVYIVILSLIGLCQILIGGALLWHHSDFNDIAKNKFWGPYAIILSLGIVAQLMCWFGWHSTTKKKRCYLILFNVLLIGIIAMQGFACIWSFKLRSTLVPLSEFELNISKSFESFAATHLKTVTANENKWNRIQEQLQCCGVDGLSDYRLIAAAIPYSCCAASNDPMKHDCANMNQRGCFAIVVDTVKKMLIYAALTAFLAATVQFVGLFCSIQLILTLKHSEIDDEVDTSSMSFRQKMERELKPLSARTRAQRKIKIEESIPEAIQSI
ncbi:hypothetical protein HA402_011697 [Bradysia odoriphaga]|nr:hypothetical protein HA402_011697 [Bradysia odoriphaga]